MRICGMSGYPFLPYPQRIDVSCPFMTDYSTHQPYVIVFDINLSIQ